MSTADLVRGAPGRYLAGAAAALAVAPWVARQLRVASGRARAVTGHPAASDPAPAGPPRHAVPEPARTGTHPLGGAVLGDSGALATMSSAPVRLAAGHDARRRHDHECEAFSVGGLHVAAASLRGLSHSWDGRPNQDAFHIGLSAGDRWVIAVVADGVSSAALADMAAGITAREVWRAIHSSLAAADDLAAADWADAGATAQRRILAQGRRIVSALVVPPRAAEPTPTEVAEHFAATAEALIVSVAPGPDGSRRVLRVGIAGDSSCYLLQPRSEGTPWTVLAEGKDSTAAVVSNRVHPLPLPQQDPVVAEARIRTGEVIALVTDGIADPLADGRSATGTHLAHRWAHRQDAIAFLDSCAFVVAGGEDDRTAVAVWA